MKTKEQNVKTTWEVLSRINCNDHTEKKNGLTYLSWVWAWGITKENFPDANFKVVKFDGKPYLEDGNLGYMVATEVTISGETLQMWLPVMNNVNKALKSHPYEFASKYGNRQVEAATMFDINTAIMRCLTKNLALFGLGHYIYAGEDIPTTEMLTPNDLVTMILERIQEATTVEELMTIYNERMKDLPADKQVMVKKLLSERKSQLTQKIR